jgi:hypothetical protein
MAKQCLLFPNFLLWYLVYGNIEQLAVLKLMSVASSLRHDGNISTLADINVPAKYIYCFVMIIVG